MSGAEQGANQEKLNSQDTKLYNVIFPIWLIWLIPTTWIIVLPANFLIDLLVVVLTLKVLGVSEVRQTTKSVIIKVWLLGFVADFIGTAAMLLSNIINFDYQTALGEWWYKNLANAVSYNPFDSIYAFIWVTICVFITAACIYFFNYKISFKKVELTIDQKKKLALSLSIFTAPYLFYLPTKWFF